MWKSNRVNVETRCSTPKPRCRFGWQGNFAVGALSDSTTSAADLSLLLSLDKRNGAISGNACADELAATGVKR